MRWLAPLNASIEELALLKKQLTASCTKSADPLPDAGSTPLLEVRPRKDHRGVDLISAALPFGRLWYG
jgi:hypothetical protein